MSDSHGHESHADTGGKSASGGGMDFGFGSMIGGFFGAVSGSGAVEGFVKGGGGGSGH